MKQTLIRLLLFALFLLVFYAISGDVKHDAILKAFVLAYIFEGAVTQLINRP